jgi:ABC-type nitrate/sulfonate/bicarbonate transport system substrate-binding protein
MMKSLKHLVMAVALLVAGTAPGYAENEKTVLALPVDGIQFMTLYVAQDVGFFADQNLDVKVVNIPGVGSFNAVISGSVDFSMSSATSLVRAAAKGQRMLAIANMNNRPSWSITLRRDVTDAVHFDSKASLAERAKILKGKTVAVQSMNSVEHAYLRIIANEAGLDPESITVTPMQLGDTLGAFSRKAIDGFTSAPPWPQQVVEDGSGVVVASDIDGDPAWMNPMGNSIVITRPQFCVEHRSVCEKMGHAMVLSSKMIHEQPEKVIGFLKKRFDKMSGPVIELSFAALREATPLSPVVSREGLENGDRINVAAGFMKKEDMLSSYDGLSTNEFLK